MTTNPTGTDTALDVGYCQLCGRWQRRRHAYVEVFSADDREEWCVTGDCNATWRVGIVHIETGQPEARHSNAPPAVVEWAADHGYVGTIDELTDAQARASGSGRRRYNQYGAGLRRP